MAPKPIRYTRHLEERLRLRRIARDVPSQLIRQPDHVFSDTGTGYRIAVGMAPPGGRLRLMMVAFEETENAMIAVTAHPLEERDVEARLRSGRWIP